MKYIYVSVYRHTDKKILLQLTNTATSTQLQEQCARDFQKISMSFSKSALYHNMREMNDDFNDDAYPTELEMEIGGRPSWYSTCDSNLLVYSGKFATFYLTHIFFNPFSYVLILRG